MKIYIIIKFVLLISLNAAFGHDNGKLFLQKNKLGGDCKNKYFTGFEIELDSSYTEIDSAKLFSQFPRIGIINFKDKFEIPTVFTLTERAGFPQIMKLNRNS